MKLKIARPKIVAAEALMFGVPLKKCMDVATVVVSRLGNIMDNLRLLNDRNSKKLIFMPTIKNEISD